MTLIDRAGAYYKAQTNYDPTVRSRRVPAPRRPSRLLFFRHNMFYADFQFTNSWTTSIYLLYKDRIFVLAINPGLSSTCHPWEPESGRVRRPPRRPKRVTIPPAMRWSSEGAAQLSPVAPSSAPSDAATICGCRLSSPHYGRIVKYEVKPAGSPRLSLPPWRIRNPAVCERSTKQLS